MVEELKYKNGKLFFSGIDLNSVKTPSFVFSKKQLQTSYKKAISKFNQVFKKSKAYYSLKTNSSEFVVKTLKELDSSFVISSTNEARLILKHKIKPEKCLINQPLYSEQDIKEYLGMGFDFFAMGHERFLKLLNSNAEGKKVKYLAGIDLLAKEHSFSFSKEELLKIAKKFPKLSFKGIAFYVKTQNTEVFVWQSYVSKALEVIKELEEQGLRVEFVDIGSGFPVEYNKSGLDGFLVLDRMKNTFSKLNDYTVILEPGRIIAASCIALVVKAVMVKESDVWVDTSVYNSYLDAQIAKIKLPALNVLKKPRKKDYNLFGNSPCGLDVFFKDKPISIVREGDKIALYNAGAYIFRTDFASNKKVEFDERSLEKN